MQRHTGDSQTERMETSGRQGLEPEVSRRSVWTAGLWLGCLDKKKTDAPRQVYLGTQILLWRIFTGEMFKTYIFICCPRNNLLR